MLSLKLFNAVLAKESINEQWFASDDGILISPSAYWAKDRILDYYKKEKLNSDDINKTFHKSWSKIKNSDRFELFLEQILHYASTYGTDFTGDIYIPKEELDIPLLDTLNIKFKLINGLNKSALIEKAINMLTSGISLSEETISDLLVFLSDDLGYVFTGEEGIKNKEAIVLLADMFNVFPSDPVEFLRYIMYRSTGSTMLIKNNNKINEIKESNFNPSIMFNNFGLIKLASIFNRFKPLFLAYKSKCPKTINKISKLSKKHHKPFHVNKINTVTRKLLPDNVDFNNANIYQLLKALSACNMRASGQNNFIYKIRNGKTWVDSSWQDVSVNKANAFKIIEIIKNRIDLSGKKIYFPNNIRYAIPTSEKMFIGNIPIGTRFCGKRLAVGVYWKNSWGATDLDLSGLNINGKVGWNSDYSNAGLLYSGDITNAPRGAVEYLYAESSHVNSTLVNLNVFSGSHDCKYKIIIGDGDNISKKYMMDPNKLMAEISVSAVQKQMILGIIFQDNNHQCFSVLNFGSGNAHVSGNSVVSNRAISALFEENINMISFNDLVEYLGAEIVDNQDVCDYDFSLSSLSKDSFISLLDGGK